MFSSQFEISGLPETSCTEPFYVVLVVFYVYDVLCILASFLLFKLFELKMMSNMKAVRPTDGVKCKNESDAADQLGVYLQPQ